MTYENLLKIKNPRSTLNFMTSNTRKSADLIKKTDALIIIGRKYIPSATRTQHLLL